MTIQPAHTRRQILANTSLPNSQKSPHAGLWLDKFLVNQPKFAPNPKPGEDALTTKLVKEVCSIGEPDEYARFFHRWQKTLEQMGVKPHKVKVNGRLSIGLGRASVIETGITLHHTYGVPVIPGSALKGVTSSYAHQYLDDTIWAKGNPAHATLFGTQEQAGSVVFYDALPLPKENNEQQWYLKPDVITVHHPAYYRGEDKPPADWDSPNPVSFISVTGLFLVAIAPGSPRMQGWEDVAYGILQLALDELGVGGKTSSGYGRMSFLGSTKTGGNEAAKSVAPTEPPPGYEQGMVKFWKSRGDDSYGFIISHRGDDVYAPVANLSKGLMRLEPRQKVYFQRRGGRGKKDEAYDIRLAE